MQRRSGMFTKASFKLAAWYVAILMSLSLMLSVWVYNETVDEVKHSLDNQLRQSVISLLPRRDAIEILNQQLAESKVRIAFRLVLMNVGVLTLGSLVSYGLARRTLQPIESAMEAQNRFTADASHELRTPLSAMKTEIEVILRDPKVGKAEMREVLQSNVEEVDRLGQLVQGLLVLARDEDQISVQPLDAKAFITKTAQRWRSIAQTHGKKLATQLVDLKLQADRTSLDTVLGVLIDNAIKYSAPGSTITIATTCQDGQACITVHNTGVGIAPQDLPHVFDRFYRADSSRTKNTVTGHGLGLSIAQKLASNMRGNIGVSSKFGEDATFTLRLPMP